MALGVADYVRSVESEIARRQRSPGCRVGASGPAARRLEATVRADRRALKAGEPFERTAAALRESLTGISGEAIPAELVDLFRSAEGIPVLPLATISVTEDMATAMRLHALGWRGVYHDENHAWALAPVRAWSVEFFAHLVPYLVVNRIMFAVASRRLGVLRGGRHHRHRRDRRRGQRAAGGKRRRRARGAVRSAPGGAPLP